MVGTAQAPLREIQAENRWPRGRYLGTPGTEIATGEPRQAIRWTWKSIRLEVS